MSEAEARFKRAGLFTGWDKRLVVSKRQKFKRRMWRGCTVHTIVDSHGAEGEIGDQRTEDAGNRAEKAKDQSHYGIRGDY